MKPRVTIQAMDAWGHATEVDEGNGVTVVRGYSQVTGLPQSLAATKGNATLAQYTYNYDNYGNLSERDDVFAGSEETEHYDALNRLIKSVLTASGGGGTTTYTYDDAGNLASRSDRGTYTYGQDGAGPHAVTSVDDGSNYGYDADGEMTNDNGKTLTWSAFGKATQITQGATSVTLAYGPDDDRYQKTVDAYGQSETVTYLGAAELIDLNGSTGIRRTLALADLTIIDAGGNNAGLLFPVTDQLGSTIDLGDGNGASADAMSYGPFGKRMTTGWAGAMGIGQALTINTTESDRGYTGQEGLDAVQLDDYNARLYDPALGRFLSVDPLIGHPESTQGINPYSYVENNPLNATDPSGEVMTEWQSQNLLSMPLDMAAKELSAEVGDLQNSGVISNDEALAGQSVLHQAAPGNSAVYDNLQKSQFIASNVGFNVDTHSSTSGDSAGRKESISNLGVHDNSEQHQRLSPNGDLTPARFIPLPNLTQNEGNYSFYRYQLVNSKGQPLTGDYYATENLIPRSNTWPSHVGNNNSNGNFTKLENGIFTDRVGLNVKPPAGTNFDAISDQTFTIRYQGETYPVSTEFEHETKVVTDPVTNNVTVTNSVMVEVP